MLAGGGVGVGGRWRREVWRRRDGGRGDIEKGNRERVVEGEEVEGG